MRIFERAIGIAVVGLGVGLYPALGLDGSHPLTEPAAQAQCGAPQRTAELPRIPGSLQFAAEQDNPAAQWKLGRMYAKGEGVPQCDLRAFQYFSRIANGHADDYPEAPQAPFVANAFVALGQYYLDGIANTDVKPDPDRARQMFAYAASYFGNADAQYHLARIYLEGRGVERDPKLAARWLGLAAKKGQIQAQALLGYMLFKGDVIPRQAARGLMWLTLARDGAGADDKWITNLYDTAFRQANDDDRALALTYLERWLKTQRE
jgi:TPR repeat protein